MTDSGSDPRLGAGRHGGWIDRLLFRLPAGSRGGGVLAAVIFVLVVIAATDGGANGGWTLIGQQLVAGLGTGAIAALAGTGLVVAYRATGVFNFAFAGVATVCAFVMYELTFYHHFPVVLGVLVVVLLVGPAVGALMDLIVFRSLERRSAGTAEKLVANLGVLILLLGIGGVIYGEQTYQPNFIFPTSQAFQVGGGENAVGISWTVVGNVGLILAAAGGLILVFRYTKLGVQVRAVVDRRGLAELAVVNANRVSLISWAISGGFAALAGVLDAPSVGLQNGDLALQVLQTISVAVIARLRNIGAAVAAGLGLGVVQSLASILVSPHYPGWLPLPHLTANLQTQIPVLSLIAFLLIYRTLDESGGGGAAGGVVTASFSRIGAQSAVAKARATAAMIAVVLFVPAVLRGTNLQDAQLVVAYAVAFLSIVAITGYSGHISLAAAAFAGLGAYITERLNSGLLPLPTAAGIPHVPVILAMLISGVLVVPLGILIGYPALRRKGLILGLVTLAFALIVNAFVFQGPKWLNGTTTRNVSRPHLLGLSLQGDRGFLYFEVAVLGVVLLLVRNLRSGVLGRVLGAMRDSEKGAVSVGISLRRYKLLIFGASAFIAAVGGSLIAQQMQTLNFNEDGPFSPLSGLYWFGAVVVFGLSYRFGAVLAAVLFVVVDTATGQAQASLVVIGAIALFIGYLPGGVIGSLLRLVRPDPIEGVSPLVRSLARYARVQQQKASMPPVGAELERSGFAKRLLTEPGR